MDDIGLKLFSIIACLFLIIFCIWHLNNILNKNGKNDAGHNQYFPSFFLPSNKEPYKKYYKMLNIFYIITILISLVAALMLLLHE